MNSTNLEQIERRLHRVERRNRFLLALLVATVSVAFLGASKGGGERIITADEVRTHHLSLINDKGGVVHEWVVRGGWIVEQ